MNLISEINCAAAELVTTTKFTTANLKLLSECDENFDLEAINEAAQRFLDTYANKIENGEFDASNIPEPDRKKFEGIKQNVISIFAALQALSQRDIAGAFDDQPDKPLGKVLSEFYGKDGKQQHLIAANRLKEIGMHPSVKSYRTQADAAVNSAESIRAYANKIRTNIEPIMNTMLSNERQQAQGRLDNKDDAEKQAGMARPLQGAVPQRSGS